MNRKKQSPESPVPADELNQKVKTSFTTMHDQPQEKEREKITELLDKLSEQETKTKR